MIVLVAGCGGDTTGPGGATQPRTPVIEASSVRHEMGHVLRNLRANGGK